MLRIWDCFLLEGPKILFRFAIALLGIHETEILEKTDTISVMKVLKAAVRLTYDIDGLIKMAFDQLSPFPTREQLHAKQLSYLKVLHERLNKRQQIRNQLNIISFPSNSLMSNHLRDFPIEGIRFNNDVPGVGYIFAGHHKKGKLALIHMTFERAYMTPLNIEFDCRVVSMVIVQADMAFVSLLSGYIVALHLQDNQCATLWELKLNDVALKLVHSENRVYAALANGTLTVLENVFEHTPSALDLYHIPIGAAPITDAILVDDHLWLAVACKIVILHRFTLTTVGSIYVASSANGSAIPMFDKIRSFSHSAHGVWLMTAHSSLVQLWREEECVLLYDITYDHSHRKPSFDDSDEPNPVEINSLLYHDDTVWVGTTDGYLLLYAVNPIREEVRKKCSDALFSLYKYPPGRRLSPSSNFASEIPIHKQPTYYIPTLKETQHEEIASVNEYPESERRTRKISVIIDQSTKKYSVSVAPIRKCSEDSFLNQGTGKLRASSCGNMSQFRKQSESTFRSAAARRRSLAKGSSMESNSSVFSSEDPSCTMPTPNYDPKYKKHESPLGSVQSIESEKDDLFDSESELPNQKKPSFGLMIEKEFRLSPTPQIPLRKLSCRAFGTFPLIAVASDRSSPENQFVTSQESPVYELQPKLRRKDLDFDETLVVAIKEPEGHEADISEDDAFKEEPDQFTEMECEVKSSLSLSLLMKLKISDKPVKCIEVTNFTNKDIVITGSGDYGDDEAILRWTKESKTGLWINDPLVDNSIRCRARTMFSVPSPSHRDENEERVCLTP
ncbi:hypothetical protein L596_015339 [Steinernema carpocapsae]|uniref:Rab-GAP TBC domain-containing protein n=1 Tax=Steinernema carpocapsae TaxID=34508 RepID=A0A4V6A343_STECR|nr:hypothetical protein L596_015339 [Steinernema carpocapsae]